MVALRPLSALSVVSVLIIGASSTAIPGAVNTWKDWTCPPPSTAILSFTSTQYLPVTTTETDTYTTAVTEIETTTVTLYQTIISTQVLTTTERTTETTPTTEVLTTPTTIFETATVTQTENIATTELETVVTTSPLTLTATEEVQIYSSTTRLTSLKLCPTRIANPTFTVQAPLPTDWTWGCPPGWLCKPNQIDCDFEVGLPDRNFYCAPNECIPAEALPEPLPTWDSTPAGNSTPLLNPGLTVNAIDSYFNMNPMDFGLEYSVFVVDKVITFTSTTVIPPAPSLGVRQAQTLIPGACYPWCNNVLLEAQAEGKTPALCRPESAFRTGLSQCLRCVAVHADDNVGNFIQIAPQFQQFMDYCHQFDSTVSNPGSATATSAPASASTPGTPVEATSAAITTTATLPTTITSVGGASTLTGSDISQITIVMATGNSTTTMAGTALTGATIIFAGNTTAVMTSSYTTTITSTGVGSSGKPASSESPTSVVISSQSPSGTSPGASSSTFTGAAATISPHCGSSWLATLLAGLVALF